MSGTSYLITGLVTVLLAAIYLISYRIIAVVKGKDEQNED